MPFFQSFSGIGTTSNICIVETAKTLLPCTFSTLFSLNAVLAA